MFSVVGFIVACAENPAHDHDTIYAERFDQVMANGGYLTEYAPLEPVFGAGAFKAIPAVGATAAKFTEDALIKAEAYAEQNQSDAFIVWADGKIQAERYFNDKSSSSALVSKSLSKPLGAIAVGRAIELGYLRSLDQAVADYITEWQGSPKANIKIRHLLDMRSGLLQQGYSPDADHPWNRAYLAPNHGDVLIHEYPLVTEPGTQYLYSNATAELVAIVIERATKMRYGDFLSQEVLQPLGAQGGQIWVSEVGGLAHSGCCMYLPADTWLRLGVMLLNNGEVQGKAFLSAAFIEEMKQATPQNPYYGLGVWVAGSYVERRGFTGEGGAGPQVLHSEPYLDPSLFLFDGNSNQVVYMLPSINTVILRMGPRPPESPEWDNSFLPNTLIRGLRKP